MMTQVGNQSMMKEDSPMTPMTESCYRESDENVVVVFVLHYRQVEGRMMGDVAADCLALLYHRLLPVVVVAVEVVAVVVVVVVAVVSASCQSHHSSECSLRYPSSYYTLPPPPQDTAVSAVPLMQISARSTSLWP